MNEENEVLVDPIDSVDVSEFTEDEATEAEETTEAEEAETTVEETTDTEQPEDGEAEKAAPTEEVFELKYNKEIRKVGREEMTTLAQKGMNYDKVLAQRDNFAREAGELRRTQAENERSWRTSAKLRTSPAWTFRHSCLLSVKICLLLTA